MKKVCFVGAPSTGKTVLAQALTNGLAKIGYKVEWVKEYARDFILEKGTVKTIDDQLAIVRGQKEREREAQGKNPEFVVCDCASFLSYLYAILNKPQFSEQGESGKCALILDEIWQEVKDEIYSYNYVFFLPPEIPVEEDGVRIYFDKIYEISSLLKNFLISQRIEYFELRGGVEDRVRQALNFIFKKL